MKIACVTFSSFKINYLLNQFLVAVYQFCHKRKIEANQLQARPVAEIEEEVARNRNIATTEVENAAEMPNTDGLTASAALTLHRNYSSVESYRLAKLKV